MGLLNHLVDSLILTPENVGKIGETRTANKLGWSNLFGRTGKVLKNIYIPKGNGETTEIDLLFITQKGIFVMESKNYSGYIFGDEDSPKWTVTLYGGKDFLGRKTVEKHKFYNPIWQNNSHIKYLQQYLQSDVRMISFIVFSERCELKNISFHSRHIAVCKRNNLNKFIKTAWECYSDILTEADIEALYQRLLPLTNQDEAIKQQHIQTIQNKINSTEICPRCGGKLVLRTTKQGPNVGNQFYGCSNYPKCRYTKSIEHNDR